MCIQIPVAFEVTKTPKDSLVLWKQGTQTDNVDAIPTKPYYINLNISSLN